MQKYFTLDNFNFQGKIVCVRVDINSPVLNDKVVMNDRISRSAKTIKELSRKGAKVIVLAHQGRKGKADFVSLKNHKHLLEQKLGFNIKFTHNQELKTLEKQFNSLKNSNVLLLENLRFLDVEKKPVEENNPIWDIINFCDYYVFDAFSVSHREHSSVFGQIKIPVIAGRSMERELNHLEKLEKTKSPHMFVFGGAKPDDLIILLKKELEESKVDKIFLTGVIGELALMIQGFDLGKKEKWLEEQGFLEHKEELEELLKKYKTKFVLPKDVVVFNGKERVEIDVETLKDNQELVNKFVVQDIGMKTINFFEPLLKKAGSIYFKGPAGNFELEEFEKGTKELLKVIVNAKAFSFMGGGHSITAASMFNDLKKFSYASLAGGALVHFLAGKELPGVITLAESFKEFKDKRYDFIVVGSNTLDIKVDVPEKLSQIELGEKVKVKNNFKMNSGGGGVNVSVILSDLGAKVGYLGKISKDNKEQLEKDLRPYKVDIIESKESRMACAKSILLQTKDRDRVIFTYRGQNSYLETRDFEMINLKSNNFYFNGISGKSFQTLIRIARYIKKTNRNAQICFNPSLYLIRETPKPLKRLFKLIDVVVFNFDEAKELTGDRDIESCLRNVYEMGPKMVVITDGSKGSYAFNGQKMYFQKSKKVSRVVDTTGAGDCFAGTFFYFYSKKYGPKTSLIYATKNSASLITKNGAQKGNLDFAQLVNRKKA